MERIGVYICECGPNIKDAIDLDTVTAFARGLEDVFLVKRLGVLCSHECKIIMVNDIQGQGLNRVVIAACSPKEHENTFKAVLQQAGLNPYLLQMANIREQCAWVVRDKKVATQKAKEIIRAAVDRVKYHESLTVKEVECQPHVLVVGAGIAGITAALTLARKDRRVYLIEKSPCIGGKVTRYEDLFPTMECAPCLVDPRLDEVLHNPNIDVLTLSEVQEVLGFYGNFVVKVNRRARFVDVESCVGCGACVEVCPVTVKNEFNEGLDERKAIYIPYAGALPNVAAIDGAHCLRWQGSGCTACQEACPFGSIHYDDRDQVQELKAGAIVLSTGFDLFDPKKAPQYGYGEIENVYTSLELERLMSSSGPTGGRLLLKNGQAPGTIAFVHCVGSRIPRFNDYCSGICCGYILKFIRRIREMLPEISITTLYTDLCLPGKESQGFYNEVARDGSVTLIRTSEPDSIEAHQKEGEVILRYRDDQRGEKMMSADMVVLAPAMEGSKGAPDVARIFDIPQGSGGFFIEEDALIAPISTSRRGIFIAGCAQGPMGIQGSVVRGQAAAGAILYELVPGEKLVIEALSVRIQEDFCSGCGICMGLCPYKAIVRDEGDDHVTINEILCRGCGTCAAACPSGAIQANHYTDRQLRAEIKGFITAF